MVSFWHTVAAATAVTAAVLPTRDITTRDIACEMPSAFSKPNYLNSMPHGDQVCLSHWKQGDKPNRIMGLAFHHWPLGGDVNKYVSPIARMEVRYQDGPNQVIGHQNKNDLVDAGSIGIAPNEVISSLRINAYGGRSTNNGGIPQEVTDRTIGTIEIKTTKVGAKGDRTAGQDVIINDSFNKATGHLENDQQQWHDQDIGGDGILIGITGWSDGDLVQALNFHFLQAKIVTVDRGSPIYDQKDLNALPKTVISANSGSFCNNGSGIANYNFQLNKIETSTQTESSGYSLTAGVKFSMTQTLKVPELAEFSATEEISFSGTYTKDSSSAQTKSDQLTWGVQYPTPPNTIVSCSTIAGKIEGPLPYTVNVTMTLDDDSVWWWMDKGILQSTLFTYNADTSCSTHNISLSSNDDLAVCHSKNSTNYQGGNTNKNTHVSRRSIPLYID